MIKPPKKKKDPNAPKGPGNVFFLFCRLQRDKIKVENPEENIGDVTKLLGLKWKALPKEEKQVNDFKYYQFFPQKKYSYILFRFTMTHLKRRWKNMRRP